MRFGKKVEIVEIETVVSISEVTSISPIYYDNDGNEIKNVYSGGWVSANTGFSYSRMNYKKMKKYNVNSIKYYSNGSIRTLLLASFDTKEEAEGIYNELLNTNGETYIETIIDKKSFKNEK